MKIKMMFVVIIVTLISLISIRVFSVPVKVIERLVNYPNPFDSRIERTTIYYTLASDAEVRIEIYDLLGYKVKERVYSKGDTGGQKGSNKIVWDGKNEAGDNVAKGGYICRVYVEYDDAYAYAIRKIGVIH